MTEDRDNRTDLFYFTPLPSWVCDMKTFRILDVNQAAQQLYGYGNEEYVNLTVQDLTAEDGDLKTYSTICKTDYNGGILNFGIFTHKKKDGEKIRMEIFGNEIAFQGKKCMLLIAQDVTERELKYQNLKESEQKLKTASAIARLGYWKLGLEGTALTWSDEVYTIWGRSKEDFYVNYKNFIATIHPDDREDFESLHKTSFLENKIPEFVHRIVLPSGAIRWVHEIVRLAKDKNGNPLAYEGTVRDITSEKEEVQKLKLLESVITNTSDAVLIVEAAPLDLPDPRIVYVNDAFTKMTGYASEEVIGLSAPILHGPKTDQAALAQLKKALQNWESCEVTMINYKKNGDEFWMNCSVTPVANEKDYYTHWIAIERDVTQKMNHELEQNLVRDISLIFNEEIDLKSATSKLCKKIAEFGAFEFVEVWIPNQEQSRIQMLDYYDHSETTSQFYLETREIKSFALGEGLAGAIWETKSPIVWDIEKNKDVIVRQDAAVQSGIKSISGIPLFFKDVVVGVLVFGSTKEGSQLNQYVAVFKSLETFIGSEINRKLLESSLNHLFQAIPDLICLVDFNGRFLKINKAGCELLGYAEEELLFHYLDEFRHPDDSSISSLELEKIRSGQETIFNFENRFITKKGEIVWLSWLCSSEIEEGLIYASAKNITKEKKLRELNIQAATLAKIGSWEVDLIQKKLFWTDMVHVMHETDSQTFVPDLTTGLNFYREDFREMVWQQIYSCIHEGKALNFEAVLVTAKNNERWVRVIGNAESVKGKCVRIYGSFQDIHTAKTLQLQVSEILGSISDAFYALDNDWNITYFNKEAENLLQKKAVDIIGKNLWLEFPSAVGTSLEKVYQNVVQSKNVATFEYLFPGDGKWYDINVYPSNGGISAYFRNIDERKLSEAKLEKAYSEKNKILESIGDAFFAVNKDWIVTYWNKEAEYILGLGRVQIIGKNLWECYPDAVNSDFYRQYHFAVKTQKNVSFEEQYLTLGKWFEVSAYPSPDGLSVYFKDITLRKEADLKLILANQRFEKVTEATSDAIWDMKIEEDILYWGSGFQKLFGYNLDKIKPTRKFWTDQVHLDDIKSLQESLLKVEQDMELHNFTNEYRLRRADGSYAFVIDRAIIIRDESGKATRIIGAIMDISERKRQEAAIQEANSALKKYARELELSNEQLDQFASITSHDLQEPLRMITSFMNQLEKKYGPILDEKAHQYIYFATDGAKRMKQIIHDILEYSRSGKLEDKIEKVNLMELIDDYLHLRRKTIAEKLAVIHFRQLPIVETYRVPLLQTLHCLLDNAIKYSLENVSPVIDVKVEDKTEEWLFTIKDNGIGIDPQFFDKIFIIFQRLHNRNEYTGCKFQ